MPGDTEQVLLLRRFDGTNLLVDGAFLGPSYLRRSQNWLPGETYRLEKRQGSVPYDGGNLPDSVTAVLALYSTQSRDGTIFRFAVATFGGVDLLYVSQNSDPWTVVPGVVFSANQRYGIEVADDILYVGNAIDPIRKITLPTLVVTVLDPVPDTPITSSSTVTPDPGSQILTGTYAYAWALFDHATDVWVERGDTQEITHHASGDQNLTFLAPTGNTTPIAGTVKAHLFVSPVNFPIEFAHDQIPEGYDAVAITAPIVLRAITADGPPIPLHGVTRLGRILRYHLGRLYVAGNRNEPGSVWATSILVPGQEQSIYNSGEFFPYNARLPRFPEPVTGLGQAATGERGEGIESPLVITTLTRTYLFFGDILDDPSARLVQVAARAGCIGPSAMASTPLGLFYVGLEGVYWIQPGGAVPVDVGWPIRPAIRAIPPGRRDRVIAYYHRGFLKVYMVPSGGSAASIRWDLDLRRGVGTVPSWWGPHTTVGIAAVATSQVDPDEPDRAFGVCDPTWDIEVLEQPNTYVECAGNIHIISTFITGDLDAGAPFDRKIFTRVRAVGFPLQSTTLTISIIVDGASSGEWSPLPFLAPGGSQWGDPALPDKLPSAARWNHARWGSRSFTEGESVSPEDRPRGRTCSIRGTHDAHVGLAIRDVELRYLPVARPVRSIDVMPNT